MESPRQKNSRLTPSQQKAVVARGNVLVMAGAGTARPIRSWNAASIASATERAALDEILVVTFTEAAAAKRAASSPRAG